MESELGRITKLKNSENWSLWKFQVRIILNSHNAWSVVNGDSVKPEPIDGQDANAQRAFEQQLQTWKNADNFAQKIIATTIADQQMLHIINSESSKEMWDKLLSVHEQKSDASVHMLQQQWYAMTKDETDDIATHISKLEDLAHRLRNLGEQIPNSLIITKILMTLPAQYNHFVSAWESTHVDERTLPNLISRLSIEETRLTSQNKPIESAFTARKYNPKNTGYKGNQNNHGEKGTVRKPGRCYECNKPGHWARDCRNKWKKKQSNSSRDGKTGDALVGEKLTTITGVDSETEGWYLDSGASDHMSNRRDWFVNFTEFKHPLMVRMGNGEHIFAHGSGDINVFAFNGQDWIEKHLAKVLYLPEIKYNLFSVGAALDKGLKLESNNSTCKLLRNGNIVAVGERKKKLYQMKIQVRSSISEKQAHIATSEPLRTWHEKLVHQNIVHVRDFLKTKNINFKDQENDVCCDACILGKMHRLPFPNSKTKSSEIGQLVHADVCGPMPEKSIGGSKYFLLLKDDFSHWKQVYFLKEKSEVAGCLEDFLKKGEKHLKKGVKTLRTDNGLEFINRQVEELTRRYGVTHQRTVAYSPQQNGAAERDNRTIVEAARTLIHSKKLPKRLWAEAINTAVHVLNKTGTSSQKDKSPYELWIQKEVETASLRIFGEEVFTHVPKEKRRKLDPKAEKGFFVGYGNEIKGYRIWFPENDQIKILRDVKFTGRFYTLDTTPKEDEYVELDLKVLRVEEPIEDVHEVDHDEHEEEADESIHENVEEEEPQNQPDEDAQEQNPIQEPIVHGLRDRRNLKAPARYADVAECSMPITGHFEPETYEEALNCENSREWKKAMDEEIESLKQNQTWSLMNIPKNEAVIDNKWTFKIKQHPDGSIDRYKARLVARGFKQQHGVNYFETYSPVVRFVSIRAILSVSASKGMNLYQFDIKCAFLYGELRENVFMKQPTGYEDKTNRVCKLNRSIYGLKQASRCWNQRLTDVLNKFNLVASDADPCVFSSPGEDHQLILAIYIDDGLIACTDVRLATSLLNELKKEFSITFSEAKYYLGLQIEHFPNGSIFLHQEAYLKKILDRFNMVNANPVSVPADRHHQMCAAVHGKGSEEPIKAPYREAVGSLMYLSTGTRPDITYAVNSAGQYLEKPTKTHWNAVKRILKYLKGTPRHGILFAPDTNLRLQAFSDADYAGDADTRRSTSGFAIKLGTSIISWSSQKQKVVALSTTESEYIAAAHAVKEILWLKTLMSSLLDTTEMTTTLLMDNQSAIRLIKNPEFHKRTKHIDVRFHFIREKYESEEFTLEYIPTQEQEADLMTKPLPKAVFQQQCKMLQVVEPQKTTFS